MAVWALARLSDDDLRAERDQHLQEERDEDVRAEWMEIM
jgi:hypothetical protein